MSLRPGASSLIPRDFIHALLNRIDIIELIDHYVPLKKRGNSFLACCPFHNEKTPSFNVNAKKQFYHCFGCGSNGNAISFLMQYLNQAFPEAVKTLAARLGLSVPREDDSSKENVQKLNLYQVLDQVNIFYQKQLKLADKDAIPYLRQRGLDGTTAKRFQLGFAPQGWHLLEKIFKNNQAELIESGMLIQKENGKAYDRYRHRIMFPIHDRQGRIIGFGGRAIRPEDKPKYLNSPETSIFQKNRELYGLHQIIKQNAKPDSILIVEGYLDVIALAQYDINNAVATLGTATSSWHIQLLSKHCNQLIFCFDGDLAGKKAAWRALENSLEHLDSGIDVRFVFLPDNQDPDSLIRKQGKEAFISYVEKAIPLHKYLLESLTDNLNLQNLTDKSRLIQKAKTFLHQMPEGSYKELLIEDLSRLTHIDNHRISQMISKELPPVARIPITHLSKRSPIRLAIALIVQHPEIYKDCKEDIAIDTLDGKGQDILCALFQMIDKNPGINTAFLLELCRENPFFDILGKLASLPLQIPTAGLTKEFIDTISLLKKQNLEHKINLYRTKLGKQGLNTAEKHHLQNLLQKKHKIT